MLAKKRRDWFFERFDIDNILDSITALFIDLVTGGKLREKQVPATGPRETTGREPKIFVVNSKKMKEKKLHLFFGHCSSFFLSFDAVQIDRQLISY